MLRDYIATQLPRARNAPLRDRIAVSDMEDFLKTTDGFETTLKLVETINSTTDDYLFIWDIGADKRWFFGDIDRNYDIRKNGSDTNSTPEMLKIIYPADSRAVLKSLEQIAKGEKDVHNMDYRWLNRKGEKVWVNCHGTVIRDKAGKPHLMIGRVSEENLRHLYNPLTGLWNKIRLRRDLKAELERGDGFLMFLDIDGLATINLTHGRSYGDALLKEIAELCENLEEVKTAYHVDHNYFALILPTKSEQDVRDTYLHIKETMQEKCTFTAGAVPIDRALFLDETQLLDSVNMTIKRAKEISDNRIAFFSQEELSQKIASLELLEELKQSVENGCAGFEVYYQPQIRPGSYDIYGVEALLRYQSPSRGRVFPDEFIPVLEQSRLIREVGMWVLEQALAQCKLWREALPELHVSVNFSALQFEDSTLADKVFERVKAAGLPGDALTVEITESMELHNSRQLMDTVKQLKRYNVNFAIDDFGTGYSNLGYLKQMNVDEIKIDRMFVSGIEKETYNHKLISNVIEFAKGNAIRTCCEGVETTQELVTLEPLLPDLIQGYLFDKPNTAEIIEKTYIDAAAKEYSERMRFLDKLYEFKETAGVVRFDPLAVMRASRVGLWIVRFHEEKRQFELHLDETAEQLLAVPAKLSPRECYAYWYDRVHPDCVAHVQERMRQMVECERNVQAEFVWRHPQKGDVTMIFSGKRILGPDSMIVLEGYCENVTAAAQKESEP